MNQEDVYTLTLDDNFGFGRDYDRTVPFLEDQIKFLRHLQEKGKKYLRMGLDFINDKPVDGMDIMLLALDSWEQDNTHYLTISIKRLIDLLEAALKPAPWNE